MRTREFKVYEKPVVEVVDLYNEPSILTASIDVDDDYEVNDPL